MACAAETVRHTLFLTVRIPVSMLSGQWVFRPVFHSEYGGRHKTAVTPHISLEETMAFGDGHNDIDMLKLVNIGVAMGNAKDEVKEAADEVTDDIDHDGIYQALKRHHII